MSKIAVYPGSFDPITMGHVDIINRIAAVYDQVIVLVAQSSQKSSMFTAEERKDLIEKSLSHAKNVKVDIFGGLTVDYMKKAKAQIIVRGLRAVVDFEYEMTMANMNKKLAPEIETLLVFASPEYYYISSRGVKEVAANGGALKGLVPDVVIEALEKKIRK
ncbi:MAG: phosphopantetheine adenylyltransferase [Bdellovibrio sp. ArHS]|uniref:pantetheine-phosphate adenylyltransferase n=1 Tax=Bdellovibrio sp. ArHS TaxID=1569284 RepID=UPI000582B061|nr:pantetheine-phosphate adenylyltransferase [Bdellovibrio sp. ArHS]KHD89753.1 MAG: phosphopantetheine adenylyltransferase [Bdellovibrio sp. ArHS]